MKYPVNGLYVIQLGGITSNNDDLMIVNTYYLVLIWGALD